MIRRLFLIIALLTLTGSDSYAYKQNFTCRKKQPLISISHSEKQLNIGETLEYSLEWFGFQAGKIILKVEGIVRINGQECYHITAKAMPNNFFKSFYDIEYVVHSYFDIKALRPLRFAKDRRINRSVNEVTADFDWKNRSVKFVSKGETPKMVISKGRGKIEKNTPLAKNIRSDTQDLLSSLYYFRLMDIKSGQIYTIDIYYNERVWPLRVEISEPFQKDLRKLGSFEVFGIYPYSQLADVIMGDRKMIIYFSTDAKRIPLEFRLSTGIGPLSGRLTKLPD